MAAPGATFPSHLQPHRRTETHQQRLLEAQAELFAAKHPVQNGHTGGPTAKPAGLYNEGNTCFFNSTFQALAATTSLIDLIGPVIFPSPGSEPTQTGASTSTSSTTTSAHNIPDALDHPAKTYTTTATGSDNAPLYPHSIPSLLDAALEPENARLLPVTLAFEKCLGKAWRAKDEGLKGSLSAGSSPSPGSGSGKEVGKREASAEKEKSVSLKALLRELGKKYDQYEDYRQQDAHELLRHLLDSMSMEEKDLIKVLHPPPPKIPGSHRRTSSSRQSRNQAVVGEEGAGMIPFADALFGGSLVSVVICQGCKSVSHTYEGFMDISLSIGNQQPKVRKRDRIKAVASKFKLGSSKPSVPPAAPSSGSANDFNAANNVYLEGVYEPVSSSGLTTDHHESTADEDGGNYHHAAQQRVGGRKESVTSMAVSTTSMASDATGPTVAGFFGNKNKRDSMDAGLKKRSSLTSWTTGKKRSSRPSTASSFDSSSEIPAENKLGSNGGNAQLGSGQKASGISSIYPFSGFRSNETTPTSSRRNSQVGLTLDHSAVVERIEEEDHTVPPKPRPEQAAYIRRLLNGPNLPPRATDDPLERLRNGMAQMPISPGAPGGLPGNDAHLSSETSATANHQPTIEGLETDLMDSLRNFTAVEVLEGDNAFACHKCWRYKTGRGGRRRRELARLANMAQAPAAGETSSSSDSEDGAATPAKRNSVAFVDPRKIPEIAVITDDEPANPSIAANDVSVPNGSLTANRSPRPSSTSSVEADRLTVLSSASGHSNSGTSGYQTSSEDSSDEAPVGRLSVVRPPPPQRRKSQHFVLQRAFKRYMIARAPPVLVFHFKRFQQSSKQAASNMYSGSFAALKKIDDFVSFPERIDLSPFLAPNRQDYKVVIGEDGVGRAEYHSHPAGDTGPDLIPMRYRLYAVVVHLGLTAISGHYVCYVLVDPGMIIKNRASSSASAEQVEALDVTCEPDMTAAAVADPSDGTSASPHPVDNRVWCYCSDTQVRLASLEEVLKAKAYMCFYEKSS